MTKAELVSKIAKDAGISQKAADLVLKTLISTIHDALKKPDGQIRIAELGTFKITKRKARTGVNPRTREKIQIPAAEVPGFVAAKALRDAAKHPRKKRASNEQIGFEYRALNRAKSPLAQVGRNCGCGF